MLKSSSDDRAEERRRRTRLAYRLAAVPFAAVTVFYAAVIAAGLAAGQVRTGLLLYVLLSGGAAVGLAVVRDWGRSLGLLVAVGTAGIATLSLIASIVSGDVAVVPALAAAVSIGAAYALTLPVFTIRDRDG